MTLASVAAWTLPAAWAQDEENPYPYGKAEIEAKRIDDVLTLFKKADQYRQLCSDLHRKHEAPLRIEHFGREAKNWYRAVLNHEPNNAYALVSIGFLDLILGRSTDVRNTKEAYFSSAGSRLAEALEKRPGYADAHLYLAQLQSLRGQFDKAEENLRLILNSGIENSQVHSWMAYVLVKTKRADEAKKHLARSIELDDPSLSARWSRQRLQ